MHARQDERERLRRRLASLETAVEHTAEPNEIRNLLEQRMADWRGVLLRQAPTTRQILKKLLAGLPRFTPKDGYFEFEGEAALTGFVASAVIPIVASPIYASWNQLGQWLRAVDGLRRAA